MKKKVSITTVLAAMVYGGLRPAGTFAAGVAAVPDAVALTDAEAEAPRGDVPAGSAQRGDEGR